MRTPVSQRSRRVPPERHFSPLDSYKSVREIKNLAWEFSPSNLIEVREKLTSLPVFHLFLFHVVWGEGGGSPSNWKSTQHFQLLFSPFELFLFDVSLILCDQPRLCDWLRLHHGCVIPLFICWYSCSSVLHSTPVRYTRKTLVWN